MYNYLKCLFSHTKKENRLFTGNVLGQEYCMKCG